MTQESSRRGFLGKTLMGAAGVGAACSLEERILLAALDKESAQVGSAEKASGEQRELACGTIGDLKISRMLMGGNLIGGWAHARDLLYVSKLFKAYNTEEKVFETLELGEQQGINAIQIDPRFQDVVEKYKRERGGKIQTVVCVNTLSDEGKTRDEIKRLVDVGATTLYTHGGATDSFVRNGDIDSIGRAVDLIKKEGLKAGIGGHALQNIKVSEEQNLDPDYYVKTLHSDRYWSATPKENRKEFCWQLGSQPDHDEYHDNIFCLNPEETIEYMANVKKPWFAFKVLAAGALQPRSAFSYALRSGADFMIVGMFDFQVVENAELVATTLKKVERVRTRPWYA